MTADDLFDERFDPEEFVGVSSSATTYEYDCETLPIDARTHGRLSELGAQGWRVVGSHVLGGVKEGTALAVGGPKLELRLLVILERVRRTGPSG